MGDKCHHGKTFAKICFSKFGPRSRKTKSPVLALAGQKRLDRAGSWPPGCPQWRAGAGVFHGSGKHHGWPGEG